LPEGFLVVAAKAPGESCSAVCAGAEYQKASGNEDSGNNKAAPPPGRKGTKGTCAAQYLAAVNDCGTMRDNFDCAACVDSIGKDQPAFIDRSAPSDKSPGACLINSDPKLFSCDGKWEYAHRLCVCRVPSG
jgi:hypothetical protein